MELQKNEVAGQISKRNCLSAARLVPTCEPDDSFVFIGVGCATPIGITRVDMRTAQRELTANALTPDQPSAFSAQQLLNLNLYELFDVNPEKALAQLYAGLSPTGAMPEKPARASSFSPDAGRFARRRSKGDCSRCDGRSSRRSQTSAVRTDAGIPMPCGGRTGK